MPDLKLLYPYELNEDKKAVLISPTSLKKMAPNAFKYLERVKAPLRYRAALKTKEQREADLEANPEKFKDPDDSSKLKWFYTGDDFYKYSRNQALDCVYRPKMIIPSLFKEPAFFWDDKGQYAMLPDSFFIRDWQNFWDKYLIS